MQSDSKKVLFLVTGMTPAIITETIWALACDPELDEIQRWIPDEVKVLSTDHGLNQIRSRLFDGGVFKQFKQDFPQLVDVKFSANDLYSIDNTEGKALADLRTPEDNERAADSINDIIRDLTSDENTELHVSIAGGRKTMGFYAGYALSLHGRAQDRMSHVLADEKYENIQGFYYPTPHTFYVTDRDGRVWDAHKSQVWLAEIPFVRMKSAIIEKHQLNSQDSFTDVVKKIESSFNETSLVINLDKRTATFNGIEVCDLAPREFAFLHWFADLRMNNKPGVVAPTINNTDKRASEADAAYLIEITQQFEPFYSEQKSITELSVDKRFFNSASSDLQTMLIKHLGLETAAKFKIVNKNGKRGAPFILDIPAQAITIQSTFN